MSRERSHDRRTVSGSFIHEISVHYSATLLEETRCSENRIPCCSEEVVVVVKVDSFVWTRGGGEGTASTKAAIVDFPVSLFVLSDAER